MPESLRPVSLKREGDGLAIVWNDGKRTFCSFKHLRENCPCASCNEERAKPPDPFRILSAKELAQTEPLRPLRMEARGHYAYQIIWNDGHDTGIYPLDQLRALDQSEGTSA